MSQLKNLSLGDFENEMAATRRVIDRVPDEKLGWAPHRKSRSLGDLSTHVVEIVSRFPNILGSSELDLATNPPLSLQQVGRAALLEQLDASIAQARQALDAVSDEALTQPWTLRFGERVVFTLPKAVAFRTFGLAHLGHHRGQLTVYLRLLDVPVPSVFGPTADEQ